MDEEQTTQLNDQIKALEEQLNSLNEEKGRILAKNQELLGKLARYKKFETVPEDLDIQELLSLRERMQSEDLVPRSELQQSYQKEIDREKSKLAQRQAELEKKFQELETQRQQEREKAISRRIEADVLAIYGKNGDVINPKQLLQLTRGAFTYDEGDDEVVVNTDLKKLSIKEYLDDLRENEDYGHFFKGRGVTGSGLMASGEHASSTEANPWKKGPGWSLTEQAIITRTDRAKADRLKREAGVA